jgi:hypothetical protein
LPVRVAARGVGSRWRPCLLYAAGLVRVFEYVTINS